MREQASWSGPRSTASTRARQAQAAPYGADSRRRQGPWSSRRCTPPCSDAIKHHQLNSMQGGCFFFLGRRAAMEGACTRPAANPSHGPSHELLLAVPRSGDNTVPNTFVWQHAFSTLSFMTFLFLYVGMNALDIEEWKIVIIWWPDLMTGVASVALAYDKGRGWKYPDGDLCRRDGSATRARTMWTPEVGQHAGMARGVLEMAARARTVWTPDLGQVARAGRGFLKTARPRGQGRQGHWWRGWSPGRAEVSSRRHGHRGEDGGARAGSWPGGGVDHGRIVFLGDGRIV